MPARTPRPALGSATRSAREAAPCPSVAATSSSAGSTAANDARAATTRNGAATKICASTIPVMSSVSVPPNSWPKGPYGPTRKTSRMPLISGGSASGNCTSTPSTVATRLRECASR